MPIGFLLQEFKHLLQFSCLHPMLKIPIAGDGGNPKIMGQIPPTASGGKHIQDPIHDFLQIRLGTARGLGTNQESGRKQGELLKGEVAGVGFAGWLLRLHMGTNK